jgi:hypothetical protein
MARLSKDSLFNPSLQPRDKAAATASAARAIVDAEASARKAKTERLRRLRLQKEDTEKDQVSEAKPPRQKVRLRPKS